VINFLVIGCGVSILWGVENCPFPLTQPVAVNTGRYRAACDATRLNRVNEVRDLGVLIDTQLSFKSHINAMVAKAHESGSNKSFYESGY